MDLHAFAQAVQALPPGALVALPRESLLEIVKGTATSFEGGAASGTHASLVDLTVAQVAKVFGRAPSTVRQWLESGQLEGYKLLGREWRIPAAALTTFQERQRLTVEGPGRRPFRARSLGDWRHITRERQGDEQTDQGREERHD